MQVRQSPISDLYGLTDRHYWPLMVPRPQEASMSNQQYDFRAAYLVSTIRSRRAEAEARKAWALTIIAGTILGLAGSAIILFF